MVYNPRFRYKDSNAAAVVVSNMKVVYSNRYKQHARIVIDEVMKQFNGVNGYKDQVFG